MTFGTRLKQAREQAGLTQESLATASGVKQGTISKIERGESESSTFVVQLAIACKVRIEWLALNTGPMLDTRLPPDEEALLGKYRGADAQGKTAIQRVAESLSNYDAEHRQGRDEAA